MNSVVSGYERLIVALDHPSRDQALAQVDALGGLVSRYKVGLELYLAEGAEIVRALGQRRKRVFLDLKMHDIPETVGRATKVVAGMNVDLMTVHASGGKAMMRAAVESAGTHTRVLAVTVLTSLDLADLERDGSRAQSTEELVVKRALLAQESGCAGVIASPLEAAAVRHAVGKSFLIVTPGVRLASGESADDQKRIATPQAARAAGADAVVVGRPIRDAENPAEEVKKIVAELES